MTRAPRYPTVRVVVRFVSSGRALLVSIVVTVAAVACGTDEPGHVGGTDGGTDAAEDAGDASPDARDDGSRDLPDQVAIQDPGIYFGAPCRSDAECGPTLRCLRDDRTDFAPGLGGPPGGFCTKSCVGSDDCHHGSIQAECDTPYAGAPTFCLPTCDFGVEEERDKCLGRLELACQFTLSSPTQGYCVPSCGGPADCPGRRCDLASGLCVDGPAPEGLPMGSDCSGGEPCRDGICLRNGSSFVCTGSCTIGTASCGFEPTSKDRLDAYCFLSKDFGSAYGDLGLCVQLCDCDGDCRHPDFVCEEFPHDSSLYLSVRGRHGLCTPRDVAQSNLACPDAGAPDASTARDAASSD